MKDCHHSFNGFVPNVAETAFVAPSAVMIGKVTVAEEASIWFGSVLRGDMEQISIGEKTSIQDLTVCHTDEGFPLSVGRRITVGHGCILHGCTIEDDCLIGMGAIIMNGAVVGRGSIVAAGTTILEHTVIPAFSLVAGVPGVIKRTFSEAEVLPRIEKATRDYQKLAAAYIDLGI
jgi:carbonic anhydrase/acetyltransferase-like protein (isoleucine patch superfamily)